MRVVSFEMSVRPPNSHLPYWKCSEGYRLKDQSEMPRALKCSGTSSDYALTGCEPIPCANGEVDYASDPANPECKCADGYAGGGKLVKKKSTDSGNAEDHYPACTAVDKTAGDIADETCTPDESTACKITYSDEECTKDPKGTKIMLNGCDQARMVFTTCSEGMLWVQTYDKSAKECKEDAKDRLLSVATETCRNKIKYKCDFSPKSKPDPVTSLSRGGRRSSAAAVGAVATAAAMALLWSACR
jgi:hypothetical protein